MDIITGYTGVKHITAEQDRDINIGVFGEESYVLSTGLKMKSEISSNNEIKIRDGVLMHQGCAASIKKNTYDSVTITNGSQGMQRIDLIVARYERNEETGVEEMNFVVIQGTPAEADPTVPEYIVGDIQAGDAIADMPMYEVVIEGLNITAVNEVFTVLDNRAEITKLLAELNSKLSNVAIRGGSKIVTITSGSDAVVLFSLDQIRSLFGHLTTQPYNYTVSATNGDGKSSGHHLHGTTWLDNNLYVLSNQVASGNISTRVNYVIFYSP